MRYVILNERTRFGGETGADLMRNRCSFTSKDMAEEWDAAFAYAIILGWDADEDEPEEDGCMEAMAERWGWDAEMVAFLRDTHERFAALSSRMDPS